MDFRLSISVSPPLPSPSPLPLPLLEALLEPLPADAPSSMPLPPEAIYHSKEELYILIQAWAAQYHYAFSIGQSNKINKGPRIKIFYNCDRYGPPPLENHPQNRKCSIASRKTNCQFSVVAIQHTDTQWKLRHRPGTAYS